MPLQNFNCFLGKIYFHEYQSMVYLPTLEFILMLNFFSPEASISRYRRKFKTRTLKSEGCGTRREFSWFLFHSAKKILDTRKTIWQR
jgi:hypothetical protein